MVYACGGIRGIRLWRYTGYTHDGGVRGIRRGRYTWRYTWYTQVEVYVEVYVVCACAETPHMRY